MKRPWAALVTLILVAIPLAGCATDGDATPSAAGSDGTTVSDEEFVDLTGEDVVTIDVRDNVFVPERALISAGTEVRWENRGRTPHNVIAADEGAFEDVPVQELQPGDVAVRSFDDAGDFPYFCSLHGTATRGQIGELRVVEP